jgi:hypothetical protein
VVEQLQEQENLLGAIRTDDPKGRVAIDRAFVDGFRLIAVLAATASAAAGITALVTIKDPNPAIRDRTAVV